MRLRYSESRQAAVVYAAWWAIRKMASAKVEVCVSIIVGVGGRGGKRGGGAGCVGGGMSNGSKSGGGAG